MRIALNYRNIDPDKGGAETYVADLTRVLIARGHEVTLVAEHVKPGSVPPEAKLLKVPVSGLTRSAKIWSFGRNSAEVMHNHAGEFDATMGFINTWQQDVIIPQGGLRAGSILHNAERFDSPLRRAIYKFLKRISPSEWKYDRIEQLQYDPARKARVVAVSRLVAGHLQRFRQVSPERIHIVYNSIDPDRFKVADPQTLRRLTREKYGLPQDALVGLFVGHNFWLKGLKPLLQALALRKNEGKTGEKVYLLVSGRGKLGPFTKMVDRLGLGQELKLLGFTPDIKSLFHAADFFVSPTYYDPCSLVVMEALACGLPVITTACNGAGEIISEGQEGFVVSRPDDLAGLARAIDAMTDRQARAGMATAARKLGQAQTFDAHVDHLERIFAEVAAAKKKPVAGAESGLSKPHFPGINAVNSTQSMESERGSKR
jgi:UDP-glucose:(heptosyl)LPS alpha-1,3-glucosyltransferase